MMKKVSVTGMGCVCAAGLSVDAAMRSMAAGKRSPAPPARIKTDLRESFPVFEAPIDFRSGMDSTRTHSLLQAALDEAAAVAAVGRDNLANPAIRASLRLRRWSKC